jgi:hypothetical protein
MDPNLRSRKLPYQSKEQIEGLVTDLLLCGTESWPTKERIGFHVNLDQSKVRAYSHIRYHPEILIMLLFVNVQRNNRAFLHNDR